MGHSMFQMMAVCLLAVALCYASPSQISLFSVSLGMSQKQCIEVAASKYKLQPKYLENGEIRFLPEGFNHGLPVGPTFKFRGGVVVGGYSPQPLIVANGDTVGFGSSLDEAQGVLGPPTSVQSASGMTFLRYDQFKLSLLFLPYLSQAWLGDSPEKDRLPQPFKLESVSQYQDRILQPIGGLFDPEPPVIPRLPGLRSDKKVAPVQNRR